MKIFPWVLMGVMLMPGCALFKGKPGATASNAPGNVSSSATQTNNKIIISPETTTSGKVLSVVASSRFAVLNFPVGTVPPIGQRLTAYRSGLKVGELKVTGPQQDENTVADITSGEILVGDEIRGS